MRRAPLLPGVFALALAAALTGLSVGTSAKQVAIPAPAPGKCSVTWVGHETEIEHQLVDGKILKSEAVPIGVTKPQRMTLENGSRFAWKPLQPGYNKGYMESYKAEIAAFKLDQMLDMHMVPPIAERKIEGKNGAAVYWVENVQGWSVANPPKGPEPGWSKQLIRMKMFDQLIANIDRNQGNLIYDSDYHLILIDHSRAFINKKDLKGIAPLGRVDKDLWDRMKALTLADLDRGLGDWVGDKEKKALLARRDLMAKDIAAMVKKSGAQFVYYD